MENLRVRGVLRARAQIFIRIQSDRSFISPMGNVARFIPVSNSKEWILVKKLDFEFRPRQRLLNCLRLLTHIVRNWVRKRFRGIESNPIVERHYIPSCRTG